MIIANSCRGVSDEGVSTIEVMTQLLLAVCVDQSGHVGRTGHCGEPLRAPDTAHLGLISTVAHLNSLWFEGPQVMTL